MNDDDLYWLALRYVLDDPTLDRAALEERMLHETHVAIAIADAVGEVECVRGTMEVASIAEFTTQRLVTPSLPRKSQAVEIGSPSNANKYALHWSAVALLAAAVLFAVGLGVRQVDQASIRGKSVASATQEATQAARSHDAGDEYASQNNDIFAGGHSEVSRIGSSRLPSSRHFIAERWLALHGDASLIESGEPTDAQWMDEPVSIGDEGREAFTGPSNIDSDEGEDWLLNAAREFYTHGVAS